MSFSYPFIISKNTENKIIRKRAQGGLSVDKPISPEPSFHDDYHSKVCNKDKKCIL